MTNDNKQQKPSDNTDTAIAYSTCCVSGAVSKDGISLIHGDSLQALRGYGDNHFDVAIVDPPYGLGDKLTQGGTWASKYAKGDASWDIAPPSHYWDELFRVSKNQIVWGGNYFGLPPNRCFIIWDKVAHMDTLADCEMAWTSFDKNAKIFKHVRNTSEQRIHICQKPIKLYEWLLHNYTSEGDLILDTHLGSGSIAIACHKMKRKLVGYEINPDYYEKACKRFEEQTRQIALW